MTDNEIIKALECCCDNEKGCEECPFEQIECITSEKNKLMMDAIDLINCLKSENERLQEDNNFHFRLEALLVKQRDGRDKLVELIDAQNDELRMKLKTAKSEAIKEFAERLKNKFTHSGKSTKYGDFTWDDVTSYELDNLVKEMESEK